MCGACHIQALDKDAIKIENVNGSRGQEPEFKCKTSLIINI
jgi:hypothetical protein